MTELDGTFFRCSSLKTVTFAPGSNLQAIGDNTFSGCKALSEIVLPETLTFIGSYAFRDCTALTSLDIPAGVTEIWAQAFSNWSSSQTITLHGVGSLDELTSNDVANLLQSSSESVRKLGEQSQWYYNCNANIVLK